MSLGLVVKFIQFVGNSKGNGAGWSLQVFALKHQTSEIKSLSTCDLNTIG